MQLQNKKKCYSLAPYFKLEKLSARDEMNPKRLPKWSVLELTKKKIKEKCGLQREIPKQLNFGQTEMVHFSDKWTKRQCKLEILNT